MNTSHPPTVRADNIRPLCNSILSILKSGLSGFRLLVLALLFAQAANAATYVITRSGENSIIVKNGSTIVLTTTLMQSAINAIKTNANGAAVTIQLGDGTNALYISGYHEQLFYLDGGMGKTDWGLITLTGKTTLDNGKTILLINDTSIDIRAELPNISIINSSTGTVTINGGTVGAITNPNYSTGTITINGGTVGAVDNDNSSTATVTINDGTVGVISNKGTLTIRGGTFTTNTEYYTISSSGVLNISGGRFDNSASRALNTIISSGVLNISGGRFDISGGSVNAPAWETIRVGGVANISGGTISGCVHNGISTGTINISGGTISNVDGWEGTVNISGGTVSATGGNTPAVRSRNGKITVSGTAKITSDVLYNGTYNGSGVLLGTITLAYGSNPGQLVITGGTIENTSADGRAIYYDRYGGHIVLGGSPSIKGIIESYDAGTLSVSNTFAPAAKVYTLGFHTYESETIAVENGASYLSNFTLANSNYALSAKDGNLVIATATQSSSSGGGEVNQSSSSGTETTSSSSEEGLAPIRHPQIANGNLIVKTTASSIVLENLPTNAKVEVYSLQGKRIYSAHPENPKILKIGVQTKGVYVVKVANQTMRTVVR